MSTRVNVLIYGRLQTLPIYGLVKKSLRRNSVRQGWVVSVSVFQFRQLNCASVEELASCLCSWANHEAVNNTRDRLSQSRISFISTFVVTTFAARVWIQRSYGQVRKTAVNTNVQCCCQSSYRLGTSEYLWDGTAWIPPQCRHPKQPAVKGLSHRMKLWPTAVQSRHTPRWSKMLQPLPSTPGNTQ